MKNRCSRCGRFYEEAPALSRKDNETDICPTCGLEESLMSCSQGEIKDHWFDGQVWVRIDNVWKKER